MFERTSADASLVTGDQLATAEVDSLGIAERERLMAEARAAARDIVAEAERAAQDIVARAIKIKAARRYCCLIRTGSKSRSV